MVILTNKLVFTGQIFGYEDLWIIGDDTVMSSFNQYVMNAHRKRELFIKNNFNLHVYATQRSVSNIRSFLARIRNQFAKALDNHQKLPKFITVVMDDNILQDIKVPDNSIGWALSSMFTWLLKQVQLMINIRKDQLPAKAVKNNYPQIFWVEAAQHMFFKNNFARRKLNSALAATAAQFLNNKIVRMKKIWDADDRNLVLEHNNKLTAEGWMKFWASIDNAIKYNERLLENKRMNEWFEVNIKPTLKRQDRFVWSKDKKQDKWFEGNTTKEFRFKLPKPSQPFK